MNRLLRSVAAAAIAMVVIGATAATTRAITCQHRGSSGPVAGPCPFPPYNGPGAGTGGAASVTSAQLQSDYDLDVVYIERSPRYPSYCIGRATCPPPGTGGPAYCSDVNEIPSGSCEPLHPTPPAPPAPTPTPKLVGACHPLIIDTAHPSGKRWPDTNETVTYTAHVMNKGGLTSSSFRYIWKVNGIQIGTQQTSTGIVAGGRKPSPSTAPFLRRRVRSSS